MEAHDRRARWYLNRGISIENIIAILVMAGGFITFAMHQENRLSTQEAKTKTIEERLERERSEMREDIKDIKSKVEAIAEKVVSR